MINWAEKKNMLKPTHTSASDRERLWAHNLSHYQFHLDVLLVNERDAIKESNLNWISNIWFQKHGILKSYGEEYSQFPETSKWIFF